MTVFKGKRFRILHKLTYELVEVSASDIDIPLAGFGWKKADCIIVELGVKTWLNKPKRYVTPTRESLIRKDQLR